ncbi:hypothetical protein C8R43DRAFT_1051294 [Mycena crocata]|nr:hypothetical protein C8R43DRAFT_1051294 [Mycena crocata]
MGGIGGAWGAKPKRRRSSSAAIRATWLDERDRRKEELGEREKAIIVRRAQKMEKVFGVAPPTKLYSVHHGDGTGSGGRTPPGSPGHGQLPSHAQSQSQKSQSQMEGGAMTVPQKNPNQTPYKRKSAGAARKSSSGQGRPGTGDSSGSGQFLLAGAEPSAGVGGGGSPGGSGASGSFVYTHYQHSLNSLHDILDRNDKESLAELHQYLNDTTVDPDADAPPSPFRDVSSSSGGSKAERRRSLPARTSMASLMSVSSLASISSSILSSSTTVPGAVGQGLSARTASTGASASASTASTPDAAATEFQTRRRRAAKLTQFFGVDYRDLIEDVLESIEHGLDAERRRGTLNPAEAEALLQKLRTLKTRRT